MGTTTADTLEADLSKRLRLMRKDKGWTLNDLASRSGVSRAMISKIELGQSSPTAKVLGKLASAYGVTLSSFLVEEVSGGEREPHRESAQSVWVDPDTGYVRRQVTRKEPGGPEIVLIELPPGTSITFPDVRQSHTRHAIWVLEGDLTLVSNDRPLALHRGDSINLGIPDECTFQNRTDAWCRYVIAIGRA